MTTITAILVLLAIINLYILYSSRKIKGYGDVYIIGNIAIQLRRVRIAGTVTLSLISYGILISSYYTLIGTY